MAVLPITLTTAGWSPTSPATFQAQLVAGVLSTNPGYTANLPGSLIEDISSTDVFALITCDAAFGETINSISPNAANAYLLAQIGTMLGLQIGAPTNTSVYVTFSGTSGFVIATGFLVSDGTYQYIVQYPGGVIETGGQSAPLYCIATIPGSWAVPAASVAELITSIPTGVTVSCTNLETGTPGNVNAETEVSYRSRVLQANLAASQGMARYLKTLVMAVSGVQPQLVSVLQQSGGGWSIIVGGGDPYAVAFAIYSSLFDISTLVGAVLSVVGITNANPGVVTTAIDHNYTTGQVVTITQSNPSLWNGTYTIIAISSTTFSIGVNTSGFSPYISGAIVDPVLRNLSPSLLDYPNTYTIPFINPPQQTIAIAVTWNTNSLTYVNPTAVAQLATPALVDYINSIIVGQPINLLQMESIFQISVASVLSAPLLTRLIFSVSINGSGVSPVSGTEIIVGDPSSFFFTESTSITVSQG